MMKHMETYHQVSTRNMYQPWVICFSASLFFFYEFIQGNMFASIAGSIMVDFNIQADKMTYLSSIYYLSNVLFLFVAGFALDRWSAKKIIVLAMLICVLSTFLFAYAHSFYVALLCRFLAGIGSAFCFLGPIRIASRWFPPRRMALVTGAVVTMAMMGGMLSQYPLSLLVLNHGWRDAVWIIACLGVVILAIMLVGIKDKQVSSIELNQKPLNWTTSLKHAYLNTQTLRAALFTSLMNMSVAVFGAVMGQLYLMERLHVDQSSAALINSMLFLGTIIGGPMVGWFSDRIGRRLLPMNIGVLVSIGLTLMILYAPMSSFSMMLLFFMLGFFTSAQIISYALVAEGSFSNMTAMALSTISVLTQGGYVVYQNLFGWLLQASASKHALNGVIHYDLHDYQVAAIVLPIGLLLAWFGIMGVKETYCQPIRGSS